MLGILLERGSEIPLWRQIYQSLKTSITTGQLAAGDGLPSTRVLAKALAVSRNTVCDAYDLLIAEGYIHSRQGAPTRIADGLCMKPAVKPRVPSKQAEYPVLVNFRTGQPELRLFPKTLWQQMLIKASGTLPLSAYGYSGPKGLPLLRSEIAAWLFRSRGLLIDPTDVFITAGATHALHLVSELLCTKTHTVIAEDPCHKGMLRIFQNKDCTVIPIAVDENGLQTDRLAASDPADIIYVTPSHQFPLGGILPASRRVELIQFARDRGIYVIEDDYDSEFRFAGETIAPLHALDPQRVLYIGTFSKTVFPALRIGYVILPRVLQKRWCALRTHMDVQNPTLEQAALAEFMASRKFDRHVQKMRKLYALRRSALTAALYDAFGDGFRIIGDSAGLHAAIDFPGMNFDDVFLNACRDVGVYVATVENYCIEKGRHVSKLLLGFGHLEPEEMMRGVCLLKSCL